jgi:NDP-4-keto-2,6-dideoxyhexose 3-C-methyltransferase
MNTNLFSLGNLYVSDFINKDSKPRDKQYPLNLVLDDIGCVKLDAAAPLNIMYGKYWYRSGITKTMTNELKEIVDSINNVLKLDKGDIWIDIACNDGTLLSFIPSDIIKIGIDPADNTYKKLSEVHSNLIIQDYFSSDVFKKCIYGNKKAKVITTIAMFYDLENPSKFINDVYDILDDNGLWVIQLSYTPLMLEQLAFDNICHEHIYYYSLFNLKKLINQNGFDLVDVQLNDINGGSFRIYMMKNIADKTKFSSQPYRDVCNFRINSLLEYENKLKLDDKQTWINFYNKINKLKDQTVSFIREEKKKGKTIWGYGASTKGNTLLQYFCLDNTLIDGIAERSPFKYGLKTVGTNIPIFSEDEMRKAKPDYLLILPWHFIKEFKDREWEYLKNGGKFIIPCPKFEIIGY